MSPRTRNSTPCKSEHVQSSHTCAFELRSTEMALHAVAADGVLAVADEEVAAVAAPRALLVVALVVLRDDVARVPVEAFLQVTARTGLWEIELLGAQVKRASLKKSNTELNRFKYLAQKNFQHGMSKD